MASFQKHSGTASAVLGTAQFALAGLSAFFVGILSANTPLALFLLMFLCVASANALYFLMRGPQDKKI